MPEVADDCGITPIHLSHYRHGGQERLQMLRKNKAIPLKLNEMKVEMLYRQKLKARNLSYI
jgi:hypothetical protein